jgi:ribosome-associated protein
VSGNPSTLGPATRRLVAAAARAAEAKKAGDIVVLEVGPILAITDAFLITSGSNPRQVRTIVEEVEAAVRRAGGPRPRRIEGLDDARWVLIDYDDFVVHVFLEEARAYYALERLWADAAVVDWHQLPGPRGPRAVAER